MIFPILAALFAITSVALFVALQRSREATRSLQGELDRRRELAAEERATLEAEHTRTRDRLDRELSRVSARAHLPLAKELLSGLDALDLAIAQAEAQHDPDPAAHQELLRGLRLTREELARALARHDITPIAPEAGHTLFDPHQHEAVSILSPTDLPHNTVAALLRRGWHHPTGVLRPAMVQTASNPQVAAAPPEDAPEHEDEEQEQEQEQEQVALDFSQERDAEQPEAAHAPARHDS